MNLTPTAVEIAAWLGCLTFLVALFNQLAKAKATLLGDKGKTDISPQPLDVRLVSELVRKEDCVARHEGTVARINAVESELKELRINRTEEQRLASVSRAGIYGEIKKVQKELTDKIDSMPNQIVSQLLNTKQLWKL
jgi:hypothetical protein